MPISNSIPDPVFFALHHKCGNIYFTKMLKKFAAETLSENVKFSIMIRRELKFDNLQKFTSGSITRLRNFGLPEVKKLPANSRVIACKRDPRSLIASCTDYHMRGSEAWTQVPREKFDGKSYCHLLRDAATDK